MLSEEQQSGMLVERRRPVICGRRVLREIMRAQPSCLHSARVPHVQQGRPAPAARRQVFTFSADTRSGWSKAPGPPARQLPTRGFDSESSSLPFLSKAPAWCFSCIGMELPQATASPATPKG